MTYMTEVGTMSANIFTEPWYLCVLGASVSIITLLIVLSVRHTESWSAFIVIPVMVSLIAGAVGGSRLGQDLVSNNLGQLEREHNIEILSDDYKAYPTERINYADENGDLKRGWITISKEENKIFLIEETNGNR